MIRNRERSKICWLIESKLDKSFQTKHFNWKWKTNYVTVGKQIRHDICYIRIHSYIWNTCLYFCADRERFIPWYLFFDQQLISSEVQMLHKYFQKIQKNTLTFPFIKFNTMYSLKVTAWYCYWNVNQSSFTSFLFKKLT